MQVNAFYTSTPCNARLGKVLAVVESSVRKELLRERFEAIYGSEANMEYGAKSDLAAKVSFYREKLYGEKSEAKNMISTIDRVIDDPSKSSGKLLECVILALGGEISVTWKTERIVKDLETVPMTEPIEEEDKD